MALGQNGSFWTTTRHSLSPLLLIDHALTSATQGVKRIADPPEQYYFSVRCIQCPNGLCLGCTDAGACNYDATAMEDDGSCEFGSGGSCPGDLNGDGQVGTPDLLQFLSAFGTGCDE